MASVTSPVSAAARLPARRATAAPRPIQVAARVAAGIAVLLFVGYAAICYRFADVATTVKRHPLEHTAAYVAPAHEDVTFTAADGTALKGWWFAAPAPRARAVVFVHGRDQDRIDSSFPTGRMARTFLSQGYSALLFDLYGHGESGGGPRWGLGKFEADRKSTRLNSSHIQKSRMPSSA